MQSAIESNACVAVLWAAFLYCPGGNENRDKGDPYAL